LMRWGWMHSSWSPLLRTKFWKKEMGNIIIHKRDGK
jgi:hypothetical protein